MATRRQFLQFTSLVGTAAAVGVTAQLSGRQTGYQLVGRTAAPAHGPDETIFYPTMEDLWGFWGPMNLNPKLYRIDRFEVVGPVRWVEHYPTPAGLVERITQAGKQETRFHPTLRGKASFRLGVTEGRNLRVVA